MKRAREVGGSLSAVLVATVLALLLSGLMLDRAAASTPPPPVLGHFVDIAPVSGKVIVTAPGQASARLVAPRQIPVGSVINASQGTARLTAADTAGDPSYSGRFSQGEFKVQQSADGDGTTQIVLQGACTRGGGTSADPGATVARRPRAKIRRYLSITANGKFVIVGANAKVYETGAASWVVDDNCDGSTSVIGRKGSVRAVNRYGIASSQLGPGELDSSFCHPRIGRLSYCEDVFSDPSSNLGIFSLVILHHRETHFAVCLSLHGRKVRCDSYRFKPHPNGDEATLVSCTRDSLPRGTYETQFLVMGKQIGITLPYITHHVHVPFGAMNSCFASFS